MASSSKELGYEDDRFANQVSQNLHCPICLNVLKDPVMCRRNQHHFCTGCITRHLENFNTCPTCMDELTVETLSQAQRIYTSFLSELRIRCDYFNRGCPEFVELGNLKSHVENCGFSPVVCSNEGCNTEVNKEDIIHHETEVCELRKIRCHECVEIRKEIDFMKANQTEMKASQTEMKASQTEMKASQTEMRANLAETRASQTEMKASQTEMRAANLAETRANLSDMNDQIRLQMRFMQDEIVNKVEAMIAGIKPVIAAESGMREAVQRPSQDQTTYARGNIIIAGGQGWDSDTLNSGEMFCWSRKEWVSLKPMRAHREELSSFVYNNQMIVTGGFTLQGDCTNTMSMEAMNINQEPGQWLDYPARLPVQLWGHKNVVHKERLLVVGGLDSDKPGYSDAIYEIRLVPPYPTKLLYRMPNPRTYHGVGLHNDNLFIAGGTTTGHDGGSIASIAKYDVVKNEYREVSELPFAVNDVATVSWRSYMLIIGGANEEGEDLNTVVLYDIEKVECHTLPSMKHKRKGCTAVVSGDIIVVMGGWNREEGHLDSVECFDFARYSWEELPVMLEARRWATACCC